MQGSNNLWNPCQRMDSPATSVCMSKYSWGRCVTPFTTIGIWLCAQILDKKLRHCQFVEPEPQSKKACLALSKKSSLWLYEYYPAGSKGLLMSWWVRGLAQFWMPLSGSSSTSHSCSGSSPLDHCSWTMTGLSLVAKTLNPRDLLLLKGWYNLLELFILMWINTQVFIFNV